MGVDWSVLGSVGTTLAVLIAAWQVRSSTQQARTAFEDELSREYRELARRIPIDALLGETIADEEFDRVFPALYQYLDLTNEQIFLRMNGRIRSSTWRDWRDGIQSNLTRPAFAKAWDMVKSRSGNFDELRRLEGEDFTGDPREWLSFGERLKRG